MNEPPCYFDPSHIPEWREEHSSDNDFNLQDMNGPFYIDSPQTREYRHSNGLTNKTFRAPREQQAQTMSDVIIEKGNEVAQLNAEDPPSYVRQGHFRLTDLPAELRVYVYEFLLPHNMNVSFKLRRSYYDRSNYSSVTRHLAHPDTPQWQIELTCKRLGPVAQAQQKALSDCQDDSSRKRRRLVPLPKPEPAQTQLFLVSKAVSTEAKAILYGSNTYIFTINSDSHYPKSWRPPQIFGAFGYTDRLPLLRNLRSITIELVIQRGTHWDIKRLRTRLEYFVEVLKQHADDASQSSLLTQFTINVTDCTQLHYMRNIGPTRARPGIDKYMFGLEGLVGLTGIKEVSVGGVPHWYAKCMQLCVQGTGGEVKETEWPLMKVNQTTGPRKKKVKWVSARRWWQPVWNWKEFAERNGVEMPEDVDKYWVDQS